MAILKFKKGSDAQLSPSFKAKEFDCKCTHDACGDTLVDEELVEGLEKMRELLGRPVYINSACRCSDHQHDLRKAGYETATGISSHQRGRAVDVTTRYHTGLELEMAARASGFRAVGVARNWIHIDTRDGRDRRWVYSKR